MKTSTCMRRFKSLHFLEDRWLKRNWLIGQRGPQHQIIGSCQAPERWDHVFGWEHGRLSERPVVRMLQRGWLVEGFSLTSANCCRQWDKMTNGGVASAWAEGRIKSRKWEICQKWELDVWPFGSSEVLVSSMISATSVKLAPHFTGSVREMGGWGLRSSLDGRVGVSGVKADRVHPFPSIGQAGNQPAALKPWSGQNSSMAMGIVAGRLEGILTMPS